MKLFRDKKVLLGKAVATLCLLAVCFVGFSIMAKADTPGTVNDNNVNIRSAAGTDSVSLGKVNSGDKVTILEESNGWYKVTTAGGTTGFIKAEFITKSGDTTGNNTTPGTKPDNQNTNNPTTTTNVTTIDAKAAYISGDVVNIRSQASATSNLVAKAQKNSEVTITGEASAADGYKWYQVSFTADGTTKTGFIRSDLVTFTKPTQAPVETNVDSNNDTTTNPVQPEEPDNEIPEEPPVEEPVPEPVQAEEPEEKDTGVKAYEVQLLDPSEVPENLPSNFVETSLDPGSGVAVKVWNKGDFYIVYGINDAGQPGWYVLDYKTKNFVSYDGLFDAAAKKKGSDAGTIFGIPMKVIVIVLIVLLIVLLGVVFFLALKLSRGVENDDDYDYDDYEDNDEEYEDDIPVSAIEDDAPRKSKTEKTSKSSKKGVKDKFLDYFTKPINDDEDDDEYYEDDEDDDDDIDFVDL